VGASPKVSRYRQRTGEPQMTGLSPAAQAVLDAYQDAPIKDELTVAAVLRALKNQVAPHRSLPQNSLEWGEYNMTEIIRERLDVIATELEKQ
jgi:hypothetical protein